jgi:DUF4097 and DUF4098 domain-containing protein YvlB
MKTITLLALLASAGTGFAAEEPSADRATVRLSDPSKPAWLRANTINGGISVKGYDGKDVVIEARVRGKGEDGEGSDRYPGMKRLPMKSTGLTVEEQDNVVVVKTESWRTPADLVIQVPFNTSLRLGCVNGGSIVVEKATGEIEAQNVNGAITLTRISGSAVANTTNGSVIVTFARLDPAKAMSFVTLNGNVEVTLPRGSKANLSMKIDREGDIFSDFEIATRAAPLAEGDGAKSRKDGRYVLKVDRSVYGSINGGGQEITMKTFNGDIVLHEPK